MFADTLLKRTTDSKLESFFERYDLLRVDSMAGQANKLMPTRPNHAVETQRARIELPFKPFVNQKSATDFLTTAILKHTLGAGVTAAAGTRLALLLLLVGFFKPLSFQ